MEHVLFAKQELERRKKAPVHVKSEEIWVEGRGPPMRKVRLTVHTIDRGPNTCALRNRFRRSLA